jgi:CheY-like chemotaxis protein
MTGRPRGRIREQQGKRPSSLIAITGWGAGRTDRRRAREAGFDPHLVKPVELTVLQELLAAASCGPRAGRGLNGL